MQKTLDLHDATLLALDFNWLDSKLRCLIRHVSTTSNMICVIFNDVQLVRIPSVHPWGMSASINSWIYEELDVGVSSSIEMQSGDIIEVTARNLVVEPSGLRS